MNHGFVFLAPLPAGRQVDSCSLIQFEFCILTCHTNCVKKHLLLAVSCLLLAIYYSLLTINYPLSTAYAATPTPKSGEVGVKAEVKGITPTVSQGGGPGVSTVSAPQSVEEEAIEPVKIQEEEGIPKTEIQEQPKAPAGFVGETLEQVDKLLSKGNLWLMLLGLLWIIFIAIIVFLIAKHRKKKKLEAQNTQTLSQTPGETSAPGSETTTPEVGSSRRAEPSGAAPS